MLVPIHTFFAKILKKKKMNNILNSVTLNITFFFNNFGLYIYPLFHLLLNLIHALPNILSGKAEYALRSFNSKYLSIKNNLCFLFEKDGYLKI
jgi:hypothetical protein